MKRIAVFISILMVGLWCNAQVPALPNDNDSTSSLSSISSLQPFIGYLSYDAVLRSMAQFDTLQVKMGELRQAYEKEMKRVEDEFNQKYELFLEERAQYPRTILLKRQQELQDMMQQNVNFKNESRRELQRTEQEAMAPLRIRLAEAIAAVAREEGLVLVVNTDADACPFIEPAVSTNIEPMVRQRLTTNP